ncbi:CesT family type III secretion system chaperone [uncultured Succinivibrio sp.]|uniref:CesT family type III secretion system chaperone n=1 Tax=uncultured Succinivibrio sp. TaxID=540749 RepID=UPI0025F70F09|nr:CesT family type III secretion system chaperone [uncultured Succinivibrio sp.]
MNELSKVLGIDLAFEEDGNCLIMLEDKYSLCIKKDDDNDRIILLGNVADELPDPVDYSLVTDLLDFGMAPVLTGGPAIGRDPVSGILTAWAFVQTKNITPNDFTEAVKKFIEFQIVITDRIAGNNEEDDVDTGDFQDLGVLNS